MHLLDETSCLWVEEGVCGGRAHGPARGRETLDVVVGHEAGLSGAIDAVHGGGGAVGNSCGSHGGAQMAGLSLVRGVEGEGEESVTGEGSVSGVACDPKCSRTRAVLLVGGGGADSWSGVANFRAGKLLGAAELFSLRIDATYAAEEVVEELTLAL